MFFRIIGAIILMSASVAAASAQSDSLWRIRLGGVTVRGDSFETASVRNSALTVEVADEEFLDEHFTGNLVQTLEYLPGVRSMDIGSGFSKPMIRGMGFSRIVVAENGIKQEGQQWGGDHGLDMDAFAVERVVVRKGPSSLLYGSDAMGGAIEIVPPAAPAVNSVFGEAAFLGKSVNGTLGGSVMLGVKKDAWHTRLRYSEQHFGDYRVPADTMVYLTRRVPIYGRRLKNTAGFERSASLFTGYRKGRYHLDYAVSNVYQKTGFFPGAHGVPSLDRVADDGDHRNVELPYSFVNHFRATVRQRYLFGRLLGTLDLGYQNNHREEWSLFHTHYGNQPPPESDPDKELEFSLQTLSSSLKAFVSVSGTWEYSAGWDVQYQFNRIGGYSFLLPRYDRFTTGLFAQTEWRPSRRLLVSAGVRYDYGRIDAEPYSDPYLAGYLQENGYAQEDISRYRWRSYPVDRDFGDVSGSVGVVWSAGGGHTLKANIGRSFRLPGANELASNGVHHGAFRHEQGDPSLSSERGWQLDMSWLFESGRLSLSLSPFASMFGNYIYLQPAGEWSILPHAGQIYRYTGAEALFAGAEASVEVKLTGALKYSFTGEYLHTRNLDERIPLSFSPPASMRNRLSWSGKAVEVYAELHTIARQDRVARNEQPTPGADLVNAGMSVSVRNVDISLSVRNLLDAAYYNHLSFYRRVELPEPGRNLQLLVRLPFKTDLK